MAMPTNAEIPFGCYYIERDYLEYLRKNGDEHVPYSDYEDHGRATKFYCGPVFDEHRVNFFVPVSHTVIEKGDMTVRDGETVESYGIPMEDKKGKKLGNLDFRFMVPCQDNELLTPCKPSGFGAIQAQFCMDNQRYICKSAKFAYSNIRSNDYPELTNGSINYEKVYDAMWAYDDEKMTRRAQQAEMMASGIHTTNYESSKSL